MNKHDDGLRRLHLATKHPDTLIPWRPRAYVHDDGKSFIPSHGPAFPVAIRTTLVIHNMMRAQ